MRNIDNYTSEYLKGDFEEYELIFRRKKILSMIEKNSRKKILEIGCGMEPLFKYWEGYERYVLIEPSEAFFENAKILNAKMEGIERRRLINGYFGANEEVAEETYDCVILSCLLHEIEEPVEFLRKIKDICRDDTLVHINVPNAMSFHRVLAQKMGLIKDVHQMTERNVRFQQYTVFDIDGLKSVTERAGLKVIEQGSYFFKPFTHSQMYEMINHEIIDRQILEGLDKMCEVLPEYGAEIFVNCIKEKDCFFTY